MTNSLLSAASDGRSEAPASRRPDIQGLRALAVLMVVAFHAGLPLPGGFVGVDVFFVISGFVIAGMLMREGSATGRIDLRRFYSRRFKRLTPALALMLVVALILTALFLSPIGTQSDAAFTALGCVFLVANLVIQSTTGGYFDGFADANPLLNTWSLSVEEQFYLFFPALLVFGLASARKWNTARFVPSLLVGLVAFLSLAVVLVTAFKGPIPGLDNSLTGFYSPLARSWEFAAGALLALNITRIPISGRTISTIIGFLGCVLLAASTLLISGSTTFPGPWTLAPVIATLALIYCGSSARNAISNSLSKRPMVVLGDLSYSWYLWHWPMIVVAIAIWPSTSWVVAAAALFSILPSWASFRFVENPLRIRSVNGSQLRRLVVMTSVPAVALALLVAAGASSGWWNPHIRIAREQALAIHEGLAAGCHTFDGAAVPSDGACWWNTTVDGSPVFLVGDSNADHFSEAVINSGRALMRPVHISTRSQCPYLGSYVASPDVATVITEPRCLAYSEETAAWLKTQPAGTVVISASDAYWGQDPQSYDASGELSGIDARDHDRVAIYASALTSAVDELTNSGHRVVLVETIPHFDWDPRLCSALRVAMQSCHNTIPLAEVLHRQGRVWAAVEAVAVQTGAALVDLRPELCEDQTCSTGVGDTWAYSDGFHVSVFESARLADQFAFALQDRTANVASQS